MKKKVFCLLLSLVFVAMSAIVVSANDYLFSDNVSADAVEDTYFIIRGTFVGDPLLNNGDLLLTTLEDLIGEDISIDDLLMRSRMSDDILSADGQWSITIEPITELYNSVEVERAHEQVFNRSTGFFVDRLRRGPFFPVNGVIYVPSSLSHTHTSAAGRFYSGTIFRVDFEAISGQQGFIRAYGIYSGMLTFMGTF